MGLGIRNAEAVRSMGMVGALTERWHRLNDNVIQLQTHASRNAGGIQVFTSGLRMFMQVAIYEISA